MKTKYALFVVVLALAATGTLAHAQAQNAPTATGITMAQYQNDVQTMEANADFAKAESDFNDAKAKYDALRADIKPKIQDAKDEIQLRIDAYTTGTNITPHDAKNALATILKPFQDFLTQQYAILDPAQKEVQAKAVILNNIEIQLLPTIDPAMAGVASSGKEFLASLAASYQPGQGFPDSAQQ